MADVSAYETAADLLAAHRAALRLLDRPPNVDVERARQIVHPLLGSTVAPGTVRTRRRRLLDVQFSRASELGRRLIVVGDPDAGAHTRLLRAYECGDLCIDLRGCPRCPEMKVADITKGPIEGIADDSAVVFASCVLEYVTDAAAALRELARIAGSPENLFLVLVEPWTLTATLYPGARWAGIANERVVAMLPVTPTRKAVTAGSLVVLAALAARRRRL